MYAQEIKDHARNQQKLIYARIVVCIHISKLELLHCGINLMGRSGLESHLSVPVLVLFNDIVIPGLIFAAVFISCCLHHGFVQPQNITLPEIKVVVIEVNGIQRIAITRYLTLGVIQRRAFPVYDGGNALVFGDYALNGV